MPPKLSVLTFRGSDPLSFCLPGLGSWRAELLPGGTLGWAPSLGVEVMKSMLGCCQSLCTSEGRTQSTLTAGSMSQVRY